jgi:hypothetical protein
VRSQWFAAPEQKIKNFIRQRIAFIKDSVLRAKQLILPNFACSHIFQAHWQLWRSGRLLSCRFRSAMYQAPDIHAKDDLTLGDWLTLEHFRFSLVHSRLQRRSWHILVLRITRGFSRHFSKPSLQFWVLSASYVP